MVFVLDINRKPLSPCHEAVARKLLKQGKALQYLKGKYKGIWYGEVACRKSGSFDIKDKEGQRVVQGVNHKYFSVVQHFDGYIYRKEVAILT